LGGHLPIPESFDLSGFNKALHAYCSYLNNLYDCWFSKARPCDEYIAQWVFRNSTDPKDRRHYGKCILLGLIRSSDRVACDVIRIWRECGNTGDAFVTELALLKEIAFEAVPVVDKAYRHVKGRARSFGWGRRSIVYSWEDFPAAEELLRAHVTAGRLGQFAVRPASVMLLRQALEKRVKYALGIWAVTDDQGNDIRVSGRVMIELLKDAKDSIELPVPTHSFVRLYGWANRYVHGGQRPYVWEMETALHLLRPLFQGVAFKGGWSQSGAVKVRRDFYDRVPAILQQKLKGQPGQVHVYRLSQPEADLF
jgi:hypothetical protein